MRRNWPALGLCLLLGCTTLPLPESLPEPPAPAKAEDDDPLTLAAECLSRGDESAAAGHFETYVRAHPDQPMFRLHLADLLLKLRRDADAQAHYTRFVTDAQEASQPLQAHLVHCHTRLMELAQKSGDRFAELLHRGIGFVLLTRQPVDDDAIREEIVCQAIQALMEAKEMKPAEARVHVYLAEAQERAGNRRAADAARATARNLAMPGSLTASELRSVMK